MQTMKVYCL